jgi:hypothetical protein
MFWSKKSVKDEDKKKLPGPGLIPGPVQKQLVGEYKMDPELVQLLKAVVRARQDDQRGVDFRVFDQSEAKAKGIDVLDYTTIDQHPDLVLYDGWFDQSTKELRMQERRQIVSDTKLYSLSEIEQTIKALSEPGSTIFFYQAAGASHGGPLGGGAAVIELNPNYPGKKQKKYIAYQADVIDMKPVGKGVKLFALDKVKDIASWVERGHTKRRY